MVMIEHPSPIRRLAAPALIGLTVLLSGCERAVLNPAGDIALQQRNLIYVSTGIMLLVVVPVIIMVCWFAWKYRASNKSANFDPNFHHSTALELGIWSIPLLIIITIGAMTWSSTHLLDPFRRLDRIAPGQPTDPNEAPLVVQVVSMDWKWLFIYPEQNIATVNELVLPVDREVRFDITSTNMMNTFYAPTLAGMIYAMPGMRSQLHAVLNRPGDYEGFSANYSGAGFSHMRFQLKGVDQAGFDQWVQQVQATGMPLTTPDYLTLEQPTERHPITLYSAAPNGLFDRIVNRCVAPGTTCISEQMSHTGHVMMPSSPPAGPAQGETGPATSAPLPDASERAPQNAPVHAEAQR